MDARRIRRRTLILLTAFAWLCCATFAASAAAVAPAERFFDYLYIEASSGSSAGGHAAVRFDDEVYHFQHGDPGIIRAAMQSWASFDLSYRGLGNRPIHVQRVRVSSDAYDRLRSAFQQHHLVQESQVRLFDGVRRDRELLECLAGDASERNGPCGVELPGAGYFFAPGEPHHGRDQSHASPIATVRHEIERTYGGDTIERRQSELRDRIERLSPALDDVELPQAAKFATPSAGLADAYGELLLEWLALRVLAGETPPVNSAFRRLPEGLTAEERRSLASREEHQRRAIVALLSSTRADRGYPLLIAMARLVALHASLAADKLIVLDTYGGDEEALPAAWVEEQRPTLRRIHEERRRQLRAARRTAVAAPVGDEASWSRLEAAANIEVELDQALNRGRPLRWQPPTLAPARGTKLRAQWPAPAIGVSTARAAVGRAVQVQARIEARLRDLYRYDLVQRNCVTEIFRTIDAAEPADLGGRVGLGINANFIPFVSADAVRDAYAVRQEQVLPSYRQQAMRRLRNSSNPWLAVLREETTLTATLVPFDPEEEVFLFFSEDSVALRPLAGIANVVFGAAGMLGGVFALPLDRGALFAAGARGMFYSFPEIAFINIRKGTVPLLPPTWDAPRDVGP